MINLVTMHLGMPIWYMIWYSKSNSMQLLYNVILCNLLSPGVIPGINSEEATHLLLQDNEGDDELADLLSSKRKRTAVAKLLFKC